MDNLIHSYPPDFSSENLVVPFYFFDILLQQTNHPSFSIDFKDITPNDRQSGPGVNQRRFVIYMSQTGQKYKKMCPKKIIFRTFPKPWDGGWGSKDLNKNV